jgi:hypothetical protein
VVPVALNKLAPTLGVIVAIGLFLTPAAAASKYNVIYNFPGGSLGGGPIFSLLLLYRSA